MARKIFNGRLAVTSRRKVIASSLIYGLSLSVRLTSPTADDTDGTAQAAHGNGALLSIMINNGMRTFRDRPLQPSPPFAFQRGWPLMSRSCRAECERPRSSVLDCHP